MNRWFIHFCLALRAWRLWWDIVGHLPGCKVGVGNILQGDTPNRSCLPNIFAYCAPLQQFTLDAFSLIMFVGAATWNDFGSTVPMSLGRFWKHQAGRASACEQLLEVCCELGSFELTFPE